MAVRAAAGSQPRRSPGAAQRLCLRDRRWKSERRPSSPSPGEEGAHKRPGKLCFTPSFHSLFSLWNAETVGECASQIFKTASTGLATALWSTGRLQKLQQMIWLNLTFNNYMLLQKLKPTMNLCISVYFWVNSRSWWNELCILVLHRFLSKRNLLRDNSVPCCLVWVSYHSTIRMCVAGASPQYWNFWAPLHSEGLGFSGRSSSGDSHTVTALFFSNALGLDFSRGNNCAHSYSREM